MVRFLFYGSRQMILTVQYAKTLKATAKQQGNKHVSAWSFLLHLLLYCPYCIKLDINSASVTKKSEQCDSSLAIKGNILDKILKNQASMIGYD